MASDIAGAELARTDLADLVRIDDPRFYVDDPYPVLARMREEAPAFYCDDLDTYVVSRYEDVRWISRTPGVFSVTDGILLNDAKYDSHITDSFFPEGAELISTADPPRHRELRRVISPAFTPRSVGAMEPAIRDFCRQLLDGVEPGREMQFVEEVAVVVPLWVVARFLGLPGDNVPELRYWTDEMIKMGGDLTPDELAEAAANIGPMNEYLGARLADKREAPGADLLSTLAEAEIDNQKLTDLNVLMLSTAVLVAGNATTRNLISAVVHTLAGQVDQRERLVADRSLAAGAVDETLRFVSPVPGFLRTALSDTEVAGQAIRKGQHVYLLYMAANRDGTVFDDPDTFDIGRPPDIGHLAFGYGQHVCPGASLARLESRILLEELVERFPAWDVSPAASRTPSVLENGWRSLPVTFHA